MTTAPGTRNRPKEIGTKAEGAVVRYLRANGFPHAERRALRGTHDAGDITGCPGLVFEVKGGQAARNASDRRVAQWLDETRREQETAAADYGILILARPGIGPLNAGRWWAVMPARHLVDCAGCPSWPVRLHLADAVTMLRAAGYGDQEVS